MHPLIRNMKIYQGKK